MPTDASESTPTHFLLAGDSSDLPLMSHILRRLPVDAYGQVFVEVDAASPIEHLETPESLTATWLRRDERDPMVRLGEATAEAVLAWVSEWMPERRDAHAAPYVMWIGQSMSRVMTQLSDHLGDRVGALHIHYQAEHD